MEISRDLMRTGGKKAADGLDCHQLAKGSFALFGGNCE
jgi:hypothetical protein